MAACREKFLESVESMLPAWGELTSREMTMALADAKSQLEVLGLRIASKAMFQGFQGHAPAVSSFQAAHGSPLPIILAQKLQETSGNALNVPWSR